MEDEQQQIIDNSDLRKYRTELPNMADDDLDVWQFRLYAHYKRVGNCYEGVRTTAEKTKMSVGQVVATRDWLAENKWITVKKQGPGKPFVVTVRDRWLENFKRYSKSSKSVHPMNTSVSPGEQGVSPHERKKEPSKKEPTKKIPADEPQSNGKERPQDPIFNAIALRGFEVQDISGIGSKGGRVGPQAAFVKSRGADEQKVLRFYVWWSKKYADASPPRALEKFTEHWLAFEQEDKAAPTSTVPTSNLFVVPPSIPLSPEEIERRLADPPDFLKRKGASDELAA